MVNHGPSRGCGTCRQSKVKVVTLFLSIPDDHPSLTYSQCDQTRPICQRCTRLKLHCKGYANVRLRDRRRSIEDSTQPTKQWKSLDVPAPKPAGRSNSLDTKRKISLSLPNAIQQEAVAFFLYKVVPELGIYWKDILPKSHLHMPKDSMMESALLSVAYSFMSLAPSHAYLKPQAIIEYIRATHLVKTKLRDPKMVYDDRMIIVLLVFGLWEVCWLARLAN